MVRERKLTAKEKKIQYVWQQIEFWLEFRFNNPTLIEVDAMPSLTRKHRVYSLSTLQQGQVIVYIDNNHLLSATTDDLLDIIGREAIRIDFFTKGINIRETDEAYIAKLKEFQLPYYSIFPQDGMELWEYTCLGCKKIIALTVKKVPDSKEFAYNPKKLTACCQKMVKEEGKRHFTNKECQELHHILQQRIG